MKLTTISLLFTCSMCLIAGWPVLAVVCAVCATVTAAASLVL